MTRYWKKTGLKPLMVLKQAVQFFGPGGLGLEVRSQSLTGAQLSGGGGRVSVQVHMSDQGSQVELDTREWDYQVRQFIGKI